MKRISLLSTIVMLLLAFVLNSVVFGQTAKDGAALINEVKAVLQKNPSNPELEKSLKKAEEAERIFTKIQNEKGRGAALLLQGEIYLRLERYSQAEQCLSKALSVAKSTGENTLEMFSLNRLGRALTKQDRHKEALEFYERLLVLSRKSGKLREEASCLSEIGSIYGAIGQTSKAVEYDAKALELYRKSGDVKGEGTGLNNIGLHYAQLGQHQKALEYLEQSLKIKKRIGDTQTEGITLDNIGQTYYELGKYDQAIENFTAAIERSQQKGDERTLARSLHNLGTTYDKQEQYQKALEYFQKALTIKKKTGDDRSIAAALKLVGDAYGDLEQYDQAISYLNQALDTSRKAGDLKKASYILNNLGEKYRKQKKYTEAIGYFEQSLQLKKNTGDSDAEGPTLNNMGLAYHSLGNHEKALECFQKTLEIDRRTRNLESEAGTLGNIGMVYKNMRQFDKALEYYQLKLQLVKDRGDIKGESISLSRIGDTYQNMRQFDKALEYYQYSLDIDKNRCDIKGESISLSDIADTYEKMGKNDKALEYYQMALALNRNLGDRKAEAVTLGKIGGVQLDKDEYSASLDSYELSFKIRQEIGDLAGQSTALHNIASVYSRTGQYSRALGYLDQALEKARLSGKDEGQTLNYIGHVYGKLGLYSKAQDYNEKALILFDKAGKLDSKASALHQLSISYAQTGKHQDAIRVANESLEIKKKLGEPVKGTLDLIANHYLDAGEPDKAEPFVRQSDYASTLGRLALIRSNYPEAIDQYTKGVKWGEKTGNVDSLFRSYAGLGKAYEGMEEYGKAEEYYGKAMRVTEEMRSALLPSERKNFFHVKIGGIARSEPAKGLTRVRMKLNQSDGSIETSEATRARAFADHVAENSLAGSTGIPQDVLGKERSLVNRVVSLRKQLADTNKEKEPANYELLSGEVKDAEKDLDAFAADLWKKHPAYAAVKFPKPVSLKDSAIKPEEHVVIFDVSNEGVGVKLIQDKKIYQTFYTQWPISDMEQDIRKFREPFEKLDFKGFDVSLAQSLYKKLLLRVLVDVPKGTPLIIIPDGPLATLPFEALVTAGVAKWSSAPMQEFPDQFREYPDGLTYLGDEYPISYYQSITALTLTRNVETVNASRNTLLVMADPVFSMHDARAQKAKAMNMAESEKKQNMELMKAIEDEQEGFSGLKRLPKTRLLAENLEKMFGSECTALTGLNANKSDFISKIAPKLYTFDNVVFATHGVMSTEIPGLMEPFLALTMAPPGTDGFLKMSEIMSLRMNADVVALTACQTGLGKDLSGEGVMSMGRAFQYAGAKSVLMSLWEVEEKSAVTITESFFRHRKQGMSKLEALKAARDDIRKDGYMHPYFWSAFILVGETM